MNLGLIGDVHAEDALLEITLDAMGRAGVGKILCTGDLVDGHGDVDRVCRLLVKHDVTVVRGNHDRWIRGDELRSLPRAHRMTELSVEAIAYLKTLQPTVTIEIPGGRLLLCHGVGSNDMARLGPDDEGYAIASNDDLLGVLFDSTVRVMVGGHTHQPMLRRFERSSGKSPLFVVNPGTLAREDTPGFAVLDAAGARVDFHRVNTRGDVVRVSTGMLI